MEATLFVSRHFYSLGRECIKPVVAYGWATPIPLFSETISCGDERCVDALPSSASYLQRRRCTRRWPTSPTSPTTASRCGTCHPSPLVFDLLSRELNVVQSALHHK